MSFKALVQDKIAIMNNIIYDSTRTKAKPDGCIFCYITRMLIIGGLLFSPFSFCLGYFTNGLLR
jgi:hypothetical protein